MERLIDLKNLLMNKETMCTLKTLYITRPLVQYLQDPRHNF